MAPSKNVLDAAIQTDGTEGSDRSCQTDSPERRDFQVQADIKRDSGSAGRKSIFNLFGEKSPARMVTVKTTKDDIRCPKITSSIPENTRTKKRKLCEVSTRSAASKNTDSIHSWSSPQATVSDTGDELDNGQATVELSDDEILPPQNQKDGSNIDDSILNSEVYQIYCRAEDPYEAARNIKGYNNCVLFEREVRNCLTEKELKRISEITLSNLWQEKSPSTDSKFDRLKKFIDGTIKDEVLGRSCNGSSMRGVFQFHFTKIQVINPNGYEYFYVRHFKMGHQNGLSKWYRAVSNESGRAQRLAQLNVLGITNSTLDEIQLNHYLTKNSTNIKWLDFANRVINANCLDNQDYLRRTGSLSDKGMFYLIDYMRDYMTI